jgi:spermidine/putrescine transport system permease protein
MERGTYGGIEYSFSLENYQRVFDSLYFSAAWNTLLTASFNTTLCLIVGYPVAYYIATQKNSKTRNTLLILIMLPFWTNFLIRTFAWRILLKEGGVLNVVLLKLGIISEPLSILFTPTAVYIGLLYNYLPFMILPLYSSLEKIDVNLLDAAKDLGAKAWQSFISITLPLSAVGIKTGIMLVFIPCLGEFITPDLLGGSKTVLLGNILKQQFYQANNIPFGSAIALMLMTLVLLFLILRISFERK